MRLLPRHWIAVAVAGATFLAVGASASTYEEVGDAPDLPPGFTTTGPGPLLAIHGTLSGGLDVDVYYIDVVDPVNFSATVIGAAAFDTQLFLFAGSGVCPPVVCPPPGAGIVHDDDTPPGGIFQSTITGALLPGATVYSLAISAYDRDPVDAGAQLIWSGDPVNAEYAPNGPGAAGPVAGWTDVGESSGEYWILLSGCNAVDPNPQPGTWEEAGEAPESIPGQATGTGLGLRIFGQLDSDNDVDLYCIRITDPASFSATSTGPVGSDTELSLFDGAGNGVTFNDDDPIGGLVSPRITGAFVPGPGNYTLAISGFERTASGVGGERIWERSPVTDERAPDGLGAPGPLMGWMSSGASSDYYEIRLTGAEFCTGSLNVPAGASASDLRLDVQPTPFRSATTVGYWLPRSGRARIRVFDVAGRLLRTLVDGPLSAGQHSAPWDGRDASGAPVSAGVYTIRLELADSGAPLHTSRRVVLMR